MKWSKRGNQPERQNPGPGSLENTACGGVSPGEAQQGPGRAKYSSRDRQQDFRQTAVAMTTEWAPRCPTLRPIPRTLSSSVSSRAHFLSGAGGEGGQWAGTEGAPSQRSPGLVPNAALCFDLHPEHTYHKGALEETDPALRKFHTFQHINHMSRTNILPPLPGRERIQTGLWKCDLKKLGREDR